LTAKKKGASHERFSHVKGGFRRQGMIAVRPAGGFTRELIWKCRRQKSFCVRFFTPAWICITSLRLVLRTLPILLKMRHYIIHLLIALPALAGLLYLNLKLSS
jgi:hypothetical protein